MQTGAVLSLPHRASVLVGVLVASAFISIAPAKADLRVCNQTSSPVSVAMGYRAERGWQSEGWWVASPDQCATVYQGDLNSRFYYLYVADDIGGGAWDGSVFMCTRDETFTIFGVEDCLARGYERTGFFEVDTQNKTDWTLELTDPNAGTDIETPSEADMDGEPMSPGEADEGPMHGEEAPPPPGEAPTDAPPAN